MSVPGQEDPTPASDARKAAIVSIRRKPERVLPPGLLPETPEEHQRRAARHSASAASTGLPMPLITLRARYVTLLARRHLHRRKEQNPMKAAYLEIARIDARVKDKLLKRARKQGMVNQDENIELVEAWKRAARNTKHLHPRMKRQIAK